MLVYEYELSNYILRYTNNRQGVRKNKAGSIFKFFFFLGSDNQRTKYSIIEAMMLPIRKAR